MNPKIEKYLSIVDFLGEVLGKNTEIIVHDLSNLENSIVYSINSHISNRKEGDTITDLLLEFLQNESKNNTNFICKYNSKTINNKILYSSTYFLRDEDMALIGAICLNSDYSELDKSFNVITSFLPNFKTKEIKKDTVIIKENLHNNAQELTLNKINSIVEEFPTNPKRMTTDEKAEAIANLDKSGVFLIKGAVEKVATELFMSESSIYRYLKKIKRYKNS
jgi:predicted transcriptional regulator YheO